MGATTDSGRRTPQTNTIPHPAKNEGEARKERELWADKPVGGTEIVEENERRPGKPKKYATTVKGLL